MREMRAKARANEAEISKHFGEEKKRAEYVLKVLYTKVLEPVNFHAGPSVLHKMVDPNGNIATWFASNGNQLDVGATYRVKATVKKHEEYKGTQSTVLTRCSVMEELERDLPGVSYSDIQEDTSVSTVDTASDLAKYNDVVAFPVPKTR